MSLLEAYASRLSSLRLKPRIFIAFWPKMTLPLLYSLHFTFFSNQVSTITKIQEYFQCVTKFPPLHTNRGYLKNYKSEFFTQMYVA